MTRRPVERHCDHCRDDVPHFAHWFDGCSCGAGGLGIEHRDHCHLYGVRLLHRDELLIPYPERKSRLMPRAKIGTQGVSVELEANEASIDTLGKQALDLYRDACEIDAKQQVGASLGFGSKEAQTL